MTTYTTLTMGWWLFENGQVIWVHGCNKRETAALVRQNGRVIRKVRS